MPRVQSYHSYIYKVLKGVQRAELGMSKKAMSVMNSCMTDLFNRIAREAVDILRKDKTATLTHRTIQSAACLVFPGELRDHAKSEIMKAVNRYATSKAGTKSKSKSQSARAGLHFPVGRIARFLRGQGAERVSAGAAVAMAAVLEYLCAEILELAGNQARDAKRHRILPQHIQLAVNIDAELTKLMSDVSIASGGVVPHIHKSLHKKK